MSEPLPDIRPELLARVEQLERDAEAWHAELQVRVLASAARMQIDPDFTYKVLMLTTAKEQLQPNVGKRTLLKMSIMDVLVVELAEEHLRREAGVV